MNNLIHVSFGFPGVPKVLDLEPVFNAIAASDWVRYSQTGWLLWTSKTPIQVYWSIIPYIDGNDTVLVSPADPEQFVGRMPQWIWDWVNSKKPTVATNVPQQEIDWSALLRLSAPPKS